MLLRHIGRRAVLAGISTLALVIHAGCGSDSGVHYAPVSEKPSEAIARMPAPTPNPDEAAGLILRFYRDADVETDDSVRDMLSIVSRDFARIHHDDIVADYGWIKDPKVQIRSVGGRVVSYTLDYTYVAKAGKLFWKRSGRWTFNHGAQSGWILDRDTWDSVRLVGVATVFHPDMIPVQDTVYADGRHEFTYFGRRYSFIAKGDDWWIAPVATPSPSTAYADAQIYDSTVEADPVARPSTSDTTDLYDHTHFVDPSIAQGKCPNEVVVWVNSRSGIFHMPGTRWYGMTEYGIYECETDALAEGDRKSGNGQ